MAYINKVSTLSQNGIDVEGLNASNSIPINDLSVVGLDVVEGSGALSTGVITLQGSTDDSNWTNIPTISVTGPGSSSGIVTGYNFVRAIVTTVQVVAATANIVIRSL